MYRGGRRVLEVQQKQKDEGTITKEGRVRSRACSRKEERAPFANYPRRRYLTRDRWEERGEGKGERENEKEEDCVCACVRGCFTPLVLHGSLGEGAGGGLPRWDGWRGWLYTKQHLHPRDCELPTLSNVGPPLADGRTVGLPEVRLNCGYHPVQQWFSESGVRVSRTITSRRINST